MRFDKETLRRTLKKTTFFSDEGWVVPDGALRFGDVAWCPDFVKDDSVMCIVNGGEIPSYLQRRIRAAAGAGLTMNCVIDVGLLSVGSSIELLSEVDASICYVSDEGNPQNPKPLLKVLAEQEIAIESAKRKALVRRGIDRCLSAESSNSKGRKLEELVHFMFGQIADFRVVRCNWRTATEELDCVIQVRSVSQERCWASLGAPHIVVEAKNRQNKSGQEAVSKLRSIINGKRRTCRIGVLISLAGFTSDARDQVLRFSLEDSIFVLLEKDDLLKWGDAEKFDDVLEDYVTNAMLD